MSLVRECQLVFVVASSVFLWQALSKDIQLGVGKMINAFLEKMLRVVEFQAVDESSEQIQEFYTAMSDMITQQPAYEGTCVCVGRERIACVHVFT